MISFHVTNAQLVEQESLPKAEEWRSLPEMPLAQELMTSNPSCPPHNPVHRLPESKSSYLSTHYELSRYEAVDPLRGAIHEFRLDPTAKDSQYGFIYTEVCISFTSHGLGNPLLTLFAHLDSPKRISVKPTGCMLPDILLYAESS